MAPSLKEAVDRTGPRPARDGGSRPSFPLLDAAGRILGESPRISRDFDLRRATGYDSTVELESILARVDAVPFIPFRIELENGRTVVVRHPEDIAFWPSRAKLREIPVYDAENEAGILFHPVAVTALVPLTRSGG